MIMPNKEWKELIKFYESFENLEDWKELVWMKKLTVHLIENRDLDDINYFTSHENLCVTMFETYSEWKDEPFVEININWGASEQYIYKFSLVSSQEQENIIRLFSESVLCSFDKSLEIFDEMIEKLKAISK